MRINTIIFAAGLLASVLGIPAGAAGAAGTPAENTPRNFRLSQNLMYEKCMACHTRSYNLPFYANIPGIQDIIKKDYRDGLRALDLSEEFSPASPLPEKVNESTLAKLEWVTLNYTMPPAKFAMVHWGSRLTEKERKDILEWVRITRARYYATGTASADMANEPLQPLPESIPVNFPKAELGKRLFEDKRLSADDTVACVTCHAHDKAGTDNLRFSKGIREQLGNINAPTAYNAVFHIRQFWDGRAADLQEQAAGPPLNPVEMGYKDWEQIIAKLADDKTFTSDFKAEYPDGWSQKSITDAIAEYEKLLLTPNSRFDKWLQGKNYILNNEEKAGYRRFKAYRCASCHVGKAVGGQSFEYMDLKKNYFADRGSPLESDIGLKGFTKKDADLHKFKVPSLRNVELTWPYLHDGTAATLAETVRIMGVYLAGIEVPQKDRRLIVAFLRTLTGEHHGQPLGGKAVAN
ncbi:MAG: cytochrome-c peroxidase [Desulfovibrio sp.]|jgi:cytochrome c peroxidase|nr:cytochrome-c peroxidase [Desulfovibrio sp.]